MVELVTAIGATEEGSRYLSFEILCALPQHGGKGEQVPGARPQPGVQGWPGGRTKIGRILCHMIRKGADIEVNRGSTLCAIEFISMLALMRIICCCVHQAESSAHLHITQLDVKQVRNLCVYSRPGDRSDRLYAANQ